MLQLGMAIVIVIDTILTYHYTLKGDIWLKNLREKEKEQQNQGIIHHPL